jgi:hypothetical protein
VYASNARRAALGTGRLLRWPARLIRHRGCRLDSMQPPPRKSITPPSLGQASQQRANPARHPQPPTDLLPEQDGGQTAHLIGTRDPGLIRAWAEHHGADPATGEATPSGPATLDVNDQGTGLRFNFPAAARFRPLSWEEWTAMFDQADLVFVFEVHSADPRSESSRFGSAFYRLVPRADWPGGSLASLDEE